MGAFDDLIPGGSVAPPAGRFDDLIPDIGRGNALARGIRAGASANFGDELAGGQAASGLPGEVNFMGIPVSALAGLAQMGLETLRGQPGEATKRYEAARDVARKELEQAEKQYPGTTLTGNLLGGFALPTGPIAAGPTALARAGRAAVAGGIYGAASGAGAGTDLASRGTGAAIGAPIGAAAGGIAAPIAEQAVRFVAPLTGLPAVTRAARGYLNPDAEAARLVAGARGSDIAAGKAGLDDAAFQAAKAAGLPVGNVDQGGPATRALSRWASDTSSEAHGILKEGLSDPRYATQNIRAVELIDNLFGGNVGTTAQRKAEGLATSKGAVDVAYDVARKSGDRGLWSPELERLAGSDAVSAAMQRASAAAKDEAIVKGGGAFNPKVTFTPDGRMQIARGPTGAPTYPDLSYWDLVRRELSDAAQRAGPQTAEGSRLGQLAKKLNTELDNLVPEYGAARAKAAERFSLWGSDSAADAGKAATTKAVDARDAYSALAKMNPQEREVFRYNFAAQMIENLRKLPDGADIVRQIGQSENARNMLQIVLGPQGQKTLETLMTVEKQMNGLREILAGSQTSRHLAQQALGASLGFGASGLQSGNFSPLDPQNAIAGALAAGLTKGKIKVNERVATSVAKMLASNDPAVFAQGVRNVASNQTLTHAFRNFDVRALTAGGRQIQGPVGASAQDEKK